MTGEQFVCEPLTPAPGSFDRTGMARGEPGLPARFTWRDKEHVVEDVLEVWKTSTAERGGGEVYLRRHWWKLCTHRGQTMTIYCDRQKKGRNNKSRWWVYTIENDAQRTS